jgi:protein subunit release factor A
MSTTKKQIKKELKKVQNLISTLSKKKVKKNQDNLTLINEGVKDIKRIVKFISKQKKQETSLENLKSDLVVE